MYKMFLKEAASFFAMLAFIAAVIALCMLHHAPVHHVV